MHENVLKRRENEGLYFNDSLTMEKKKKFAKNTKTFKNQLVSKFA